MTFQPILLIHAKLNQSAGIPMDFDSPFKHVLFISLLLK